ncbi:hypothetical protein B0H16DRAFT_1695326 [Mycena metata]|uniref:Uncharacterized protein n=1 Tax=Mycena metata TaxID=1033252 RepID=A0AAD7I8M1_9AGAR|nr:hypothetical protein B0H16DRAFT_1695326 [Mycena metata]
MSVATAPLHMDDVIADPAIVANALSIYMKDDITRKRMINKVKEGLQAIHDIQVAFESVYGLLAKVDAESFTGSDGNVIQEFAPHGGDTAMLAFTASLSQTETLAAKGKAAIDTFVKTIIPILQNTDMSVDAKKKRLDFFIANMDQNGHNVKDIDALIIVFDGISKDATAFEATFKKTMAQVSNKLATDTRHANEAIAVLLKKLDAQMNTCTQAKDLGIVAGASLQHLLASQADTAELADIRNNEIELAAASYANLAQILETFADGWTTASTATQ